MRCASAVDEAIVGESARKIGRAAEETEPATFRTHRSVRFTAALVRVQTHRTGDRVGAGDDAPLDRDAAVGRHLGRSQETRLDVDSDDARALGAIGAVGLVVLLTTVATRLQRVTGGTARGRWGALTAGMPSPQFLVAMGAAFLVSGAFYEVLHFRHLWAFLGLLAGLDLIRADRLADSGR